VSKEHRPHHRNPRTKELLENKEQVCPSCFENFGTTEAGDKHRDLTKKKFNCLSPKLVGLVSIENSYGTVVWRIPND
jgi:hypothetical protein